MQGNDSQQISQADNNNHRPTSNLPKVNVPKFSGKHAEFKNFISLFESLVHNDASLTNVEKFNHLLSCLGTVKAFQISESNYEKALDSLQSVYDNKCLIFFDTVSESSVSAFSC